MLCSFSMRMCGGCSVRFWYGYLLFGRDGVGRLFVMMKVCFCWCVIVCVWCWFFIVVVVFCSCGWMCVVMKLSCGLFMFGYWFNGFSCGYCLFICCFVRRFFYDVYEYEFCVVVVCEVVFVCCGIGCSWCGIGCDWLC